ncbi:MAG: metK [Firmicutes bacterium]|nr:metK [Bacillota bacterium]
MKKNILITSESVTEGHPDKLCDQISDKILDEFIAKDRQARVAVETMASDQIIFIAGEISSTAKVDIAAAARSVIREIGYIDQAYGLDAEKCLILSNINVQSTDIAAGVNKAMEYKQQMGDWQDQIKNLGAGDQGMMYGFACRETSDYMPLPIYLAHRLAERLAKVRKDGRLPYLRPDGKTQVTIEYDANGWPIALDSIIIAAQHDATVSYPKLCEDIINQVINPLLPANLHTSDMKLYVNSTGKFLLGGPRADTGLTGRKIMVDTYGGLCRHGGGAFSGKDPSKVDRSGAYMARYVAKNIVAAGIADRCEISLAYAIGVAQPVAINVHTYGTEKIVNEQIVNLVLDQFDFRPGAIIENFDLLRPIYKETAVYGHFGRNDKKFPWERIDKVSGLRKAVFGD